MVENELVEKKVVAGRNVEREVIEKDGMVEQKDKDKLVEEVWIADWDVEDVVVFGFRLLFFGNREFFRL